MEANRVVKLLALGHAMAVWLRIVSGVEFSRTVSAQELLGCPGAIVYVLPTRPRDDRTR
jgi:hypothetical protein